MLNINDSVYSKKLFLPWHRFGFRTDRPGCEQSPSLLVIVWEVLKQILKVTAWLSNNLQKPDKGFIFLESLQNEAGIVVGGALLDAENPDWCRTHFSDRDWSADQKYVGSANKDCMEKKREKYAGCIQLWFSC